MFSGKKGVAKAVAASGLSWSLTFEIEDGENQNLDDPDVRRLIETLVALFVFHTVGAAVMCRSYGVDGVSQKMKTKVSEGNSQAIWIAALVCLCQACNVIFWVESPDSSFIWSLPEFKALFAHIFSFCFRLDMCVCRIKKENQIFHRSSFVKPIQVL